MAANSNIQWTDSTHNEWYGCTAVSPACDHCYAEAMMDKRLHKVTWGAGQPRQRTSAQNRALPIRWSKSGFAECVDCGWRGEPKDAPQNCRLQPARRRVFSLSLGDWLDKEVPIEWFVEFMLKVRRTPNLDWLLLTKRIGYWRKRLEEAVAFLQGTAQTEHRDELLLWLGAWLGGQPPDNVWVGATIVNQEELLRDAGKLLQVPAVVRFLSMEPLLGQVDLDLIGFDVGDDQETMDQHILGPGRIAWVIVGGENVKKTGIARPMHPAWLDDIQCDCEQYGAAFFFKQWGSWIPLDQLTPARVVEAREKFLMRDEHYIRIDGTTHTTQRDDHSQASASDVLALEVGVDFAGRLLNGREYSQFPNSAVPA